MPSITIPESAFPAIQNLIRLNEADFDAFLKALAHASPSLSQNKFWQHVAPHIAQIDRSVVRSIVDELFSMDFVRDDIGLPVKDFAKLMAEALEEIESPETSFSKDDAAMFEDRLTKIFDARKVLSITTKAIDILTDEPHIFYSARILTDIRPIFNDDGNAIDAAVIVHNLKIHYGKNEDHRDFYVALDTSDIQVLREVLDRAAEKAKCLQGLLKTTGVSYLDAEE
jgi:hypothetical protein